MTAAAGAPSLDGDAGPELEARSATGWPRSRTLLRDAGQERRRRSSPRPPGTCGRRRQAVPPAAGAAGRRVRRPGRDPDVRAAAAVRRRADPPRLALPRRRDGRGRAAPRRRRRPTRAGTTTSRSSPATSCSPEPPSSLADLGAGGRAHPGPDLRRGWSRARSARPSGPADGEDPLEHYLRRRRRQDRLADRDLGPVRRAVRRRAAEVDVEALTRVRRDGSASPSSSPTTSSTSPRESDESGKTPGTDLREGVPTLPVLHRAAVRPTRPTPGCSSCSTATCTDDADARRGAGSCCGRTPRWTRPGPRSRRWADAARDVLAPLPDVPAKDALAALCDQVVGRTT